MRVSFFSFLSILAAIAEDYEIKNVFLLSPSLSALFFFALARVSGAGGTKKYVEEGTKKERKNGG